MNTHFTDSPEKSPPMELQLKISEVCGWKCTFCSSTKISDDHYQILDIDAVYDFLKRFPDTSTLIINGGDPLMIKPQYYWDIIKYLDDNNMSTSISFTTNLWPFFKNPDKWTPLLSHPRCGVTTSFNYGDTRRISHDRVYTVDDFWAVSDMFLDRIGYRPDFISVITDENEESAIENVVLAKRMDVECKLNYGMASGDLAKSYQLSKIYQTYLKIYNMGLAEWEYNTKQMIERLSTGATTCPQSRNCDGGIRALNPDGQYFSCGSFADDRDKPINFVTEVKLGQFFTPLSDDIDLAVLKQECYSCPMFNICNGCRKTIKDMKMEGIVEDHCSLMKTIADDIIHVNSNVSSRIN